MAREALGEFEHLVMLAILRLGPNAYGVPIVTEIEDRADRPAARAAVYIALRRLEAKGLIKSRLADPTPERGGRAKRYYKLTAAGVRQLRDTRQAFTRMWEGLDPALRLDKS